MRPVLYKSTETDFDTNGLGVLTDCESCFVEEERNGQFVLDAEYPITGRWFKQIDLRRIILAKPNLEQEPQPFRITRMIPSFSGGKTVAKIHAVHWSYDLSGVPVLPFAAENLAAAVTAINDGKLRSTPITLTTNKSVTGRMDPDVPHSFRSLLGGIKGSLLDCYGGEYRWGKYEVELLQARGADRGFSIRYGKNMTSLEQERDGSAVYTGVYPYWKNQDGDYIELPERTINAAGSFDYEKIYILDLSDQFDEKPTEAQLRARATQYMLDNGIGVPSIHTKVTYAQNPRLLDAVHLCDTVQVYYDALGVEATAKVIKTRFDVLKERYAEIELGNAKSSLASTIVGINTSMDEERAEMILYAHDIKKELEETIDTLRVSISDTAAGAATQLQLATDSIMAIVSNLDKALTETMDANSATWAFVERVQSALQDAADESNGKFETIERYIRFIDGTIVIGILGNLIKLKLMNDAVFFFSGQDDTTDLGNAFAYFTSEELHVKKLSVSESASIGHWFIGVLENDDLVIDYIA